MADGRTASIDYREVAPLAAEAGRLAEAIDADVIKTYVRLGLGVGIARMGTNIRDASGAAVELVNILREHLADGTAAIIAAGCALVLKGQAEIAKQSLELFASIYGAEAGNLALKSLSLDGVYVAGGMAPKLIKKLQDGTFMKAFVNKGRYKRLLSNMPVKVVMNQQTALLGAASVAAALSQGATS